MFSCGPQTFHSQYIKKKVIIFSICVIGTLTAAAAAVFALRCIAAAVARPRPLPAPPAALRRDWLNNQICHSLRDFKF